MEPQVATLSPPVDPERDHVRGGADAPVTLVEYGDFQCPYCGDAYPIVNDLLERFGDQLSFVFRHMPLPDLHPRAPFAAEAAEAAAAQGRFWEMHDRLFEHQHQLADAELRAHGVPSTPRFFVNGLIHLGSASYPELSEAISEELAVSGRQH
jgi:Na+:H+ antiporter, NhaA family